MCACRNYLRLYPLHSNVPGWPANLPAVMPDDCPEISDVLPPDVDLFRDDAETENLKPSQGRNDETRAT